MSKEDQIDLEILEIRIPRCLWDFVNFDTEDVTIIPTLEVKLQGRKNEPHQFRAVCASTIANGEKVFFDFVLVVEVTTGGVDFEKIREDAEMHEYIGFFISELCVSEARTRLIMATQAAGLGSPFILAPLDRATYKMSNP